MALLSRAMISLCWLLVAMVFSMSSQPPGTGGAPQRMEPSDSDPSISGSPRQMRILALFSGTRNGLGLDHRLGRQVLKLAVGRAKQLHPELGEVELVIHSDDTDCSGLNEIPSRVVEQFYGGNTRQQCESMSIGDHHEDNPQSTECTINRTSRMGRRVQWQQAAGSLQLPPINNTKQQQQPVIDAIIGPSCDHLVDLVARMAAYWRTPIYSVASVGAAFGRKDIYTTLTRLSPSIDHLSTFVVKTMERFKWRHMAIIIDKRQIENRILWENLDRTINKLRYTIPIDRKLIEFRASEEEEEEADRTRKSEQETGSLCSTEARATLLDARRVARVFLFLISDHQLIRRLLLCANELMMANGEFAFLAIDMGLKSAEVSRHTTSSSVPEVNNDRQLQEGDGGSLSSGASQPAPTSAKSMVSRSAQTLDWYLADDEANNMIAKRTFESLMVFSVELPISDEFSLFVEQTLDMAQQEFPGSRFERSSVGPLAVALHDSLLLAVEAHAKQQVSRLPDVNSSKRLKFGGRNDASNDDDDDDSNDAGNEMDKTRPSMEPALMWNERYSGGLIANMHINSNGDQELDYVLGDLEPEMGLMRPVARYAKETRQIEPLAGSYVHWPARPGAPSGERPPPDEPECGFNDDAERCIDRQNLYAALSIVSVLLLLILASAFVSLRKYRRIKYQMQLDDYWWKINWQDLQFIQTTDSLVSSNPQSVARALRSGGSVVSSQASGSVISYATVTRKRAATHHPAKLLKQHGGDEDHSPGGALKGARRSAVPVIVTSNMDSAAEQRATTSGGSMGAPSEIGSAHHRSVVAASLKGSELSPSCMLIRSDYSSVVRASNLALYKNELVIVKQLNCKTNIEVSHDLLVDLRSMREHLHENLARFLGLCVEPERLAIVYEYCSRGSLQDMLLNESIAIDWTLKCSIIGDILNGLNFIHTTLLNYHGRLKSTNLVLDSRFTVKITDFGLQNLYSQLDILEDRRGGDDDSDSDDGGGDGNSVDYGGRRGEENRMRLDLQRDTLSLSVSQRAIGGPNPMSGSRRSESNPAGKSNKKLKLKNKGAARYFWTAPEHLRMKDLHHAGSKRGDVYSLAIILFELLTRREPYYYGTNAKPHWATIKRERQETGGGAPGAGQQRLSTFGAGLAPRGSMISSNVASSVGRRAQSKLRRIGASVGPQQHDDPGDTGSSVSNHSGSAGASEPAATAAGSHNRHSKQAKPHVNHHSRTLRLSVAAIDTGEAETIPEMEEGTEVGNDNGHKQAIASEGTDEPIDAEEILDQLRMGLQPEPVRPHLPNFVLHEMNPKLVELMRECWSETPANRPTLVQIRNQMRKLTKGMASRNYLDNLLERLQNYAADLERIVDVKSSDIVAEKFRTEELLYQLVPKFVAERLNRNEPIIPQVFDGVTIFFSDIVGFEKYASVMSPCDLVDLLNSIYSSFESVITSFDVTKIETIIDQFLIASGISLEQHHQQQQQINPSGQQSGQTQGAQEQNSEQLVAGGGGGASKSRRSRLLGSLRHSYGSSDNKNQSLDLVASGNQDQPDMAAAGGDKSYYRRSSAEQIARMALCLRDQMKSFYFRGSGSTGGDTNGADAARVTKMVATNFNIRIGIHSGKVCAGIIGVKRPKFCLIGDTVNVASRMHTNSKANKIQISADTKELLGQVPGFSIEPRGKIEVKGKGMMETYWLESSF